MSVVNELYFDGVDYSKLTVRQLQDASIATSRTFEQAVLNTVDKKQSVDTFLKDMERIDGANAVITTAFERALDNVLR